MVKCLVHGRRSDKVIINDQRNNLVTRWSNDQIVGWICRLSNDLKTLIKRPDDNLCAEANLVEIIFSSIYNRSVNKLTSNCSRWLSKFLFFIMDGFQNSEKTCESLGETHWVRAVVQESPSRSPDCSNLKVTIVTIVLGTMYVPRTLKLQPGNSNIGQSREFHWTHLGATSVMTCSLYLFSQSICSGLSFEYLKHVT